MPKKSWTQYSNNTLKHSLQWEAEREALEKRFRLGKTEPKEVGRRLSGPHRETLLKRLMQRVRFDYQSGCWNWTGAMGGSGYGGYLLHNKTFPAHRITYTMISGDIPDGLTLDHLCRNRACVNPLHLEPVTNYENIIRGNSLSAQNSRKTKCNMGHPLPAYKQGQGRDCRPCNTIRKRGYKKKRVNTFLSEVSFPA